MMSIRPPPSIKVPEGGGMALALWQQHRACERRSTDPQLLSHVVQVVPEDNWESPGMLR